MKITTEAIKDVGGKRVAPPRKLGAKHIVGGKWQEGKNLLAAIVYTPHGEHFKEIYQTSVLEEIRRGFHAADFYSLDQVAVEKLKVIASCT